MKIKTAVLLLYVLSVSALPAVQTVSVPVDSITGSLRSAISLAAAGDTICFRIPEKDTISIWGKLAISRDLTINGKNLETGQRMVINHWGDSAIVITGGNVNIKDIVIDNSRTYGSIGRHIHVVGRGTTLLMENALLTGGKNEDEYKEYSGALAVDSASLTLKNCVISQNSSSPGNTSKGGGICNQCGTLTIVECTISENCAQLGGGIYSVNGIVSIVKSTIVSNSASDGAGIYNNGGVMTMTGCKIIRNKASSGGGGIFNMSGTLALSGTSILADTAINGGGLCNSFGNVTLDTCTVSDNVAWANSQNIYALTWFTVTASGGGIANQNGPMTIRNTTLSNNLCYASGGSSDRLAALQTIANGGGIYNNLGKCIILNSILDTNLASAYSQVERTSSKREIAQGGGLYNREGLMTIVNCTIARNRSQGDSTSGGGGIFMEQGTMTIVSSTVNGNLDGNGSPILPAECYVLNSIILNCNVGKTFKVALRAVGMLTAAGAEHPSVFISCDTQATAEKLFIGNDGTPGDFGGLTKTVSLGSSLSGAFGRGIRSGWYDFFDTTLRRGDTIPKAVYHNGTSWLTLESDSPLPAGAVVFEITTDQRGVTRANPPCAGAYEVKTGEGAIRFADLASKRSVPEVVLSYDRRSLLLKGLTDGNVELFTCSGQRFFSGRVTSASGVTRIALPAHARGLVLCRIKTIEASITRCFFR